MPHWFHLLWWREGMGDSTHHLVLSERKMQSSLLIAANVREHNWGQEAELCCAFGCINKCRSWRHKKGGKSLRDSKHWSASALQSGQVTALIPLSGYKVTAQLQPTEGMQRQEGVKCKEEANPETKTMPDPNSSWPQTKVRVIHTGTPAQPQGSRGIRTQQSLGLTLGQREKFLLLVKSWASKVSYPPTSLTSLLRARIFPFVSFSHGILSHLLRRQQRPIFNRH